MKKRTHGWFARIMIQLFGMNPPVKESNSNAGAAGGTPPVVVNNPQPSPAQSNNTPDASTQSAPLGVTSDFAGIVKFRNSADCRDWPVTVTVSNVEVRGGNIYWKDSGRDGRWNEKRGKKTVNGECLLVIPSRGEAGMFDYVAVGQKTKILSNLKPSHEGQGFFPGWQPVKGERVGFLLATISRDRGAAKMKERSNVVWFTWPRDGI